MKNSCLFKQKKIQWGDPLKGLPSQIFNCDESGFVTDPKSQTVLTQKGSSQVNQCIGGMDMNRSVNCCISASGQVLPPHIVYEKKNLFMD